jgi:histidinol-phosphate aminotransferase
VLRTLSKSYSLAGARLGLMFGHPDLLAECRKVKDSYNVNALTQALGVAALSATEYHATLVARSLAGRAELVTGCRMRGWPCAPSGANFVLARVGPAAGARYRALRDRGILVRWWDRPELSDCLRISVGTPEQQALLFAALDEVAE